MTQPDPDAQRLSWVEHNAGVYGDPDPDDDPHQPDTLDWFDR